MTLPAFIIESAYVCSIIISIMILCPRRMGFCKQLLLIPIGCVGYMGVDYMVGHDNVIIVGLAAVAESVLILILIMLGTEGNIWLNYVKCVLNAYLVNIFTVIVSMFYKPLYDGYVAFLKGQDFQIKYILIIAAITIIVAYFSAKAFKGVFNRMNKISSNQARAMVIIVLVLCMPAYFLKQEIFKDKIDAGEDASVIMAVIMSTLMCALFFVVPSILIKRKMYKANEQRKLYIKQQKEHYNNLVASNAKLQQLSENKDMHDVREKLRDIYMQPLSGDVVIDATIDTFSQRATDEGIIFECSIAPITDAHYRYELVGMMNEVLDEAFAQAKKNVEKPWVKLSIRQKQGMIAMEVATSKAKSNRSFDDNYRYKNTRNFLNEISGSMLVSDEGCSGSIQLLLPAV